MELDEGDNEVMSTDALLGTLANLEAYCEACEKFRPVRKVISRDSENHREYHELLCTSAPASYSHTRSAGREAAERQAKKRRG